MATESIGSFVEVDIMVSPVKSPQGGDASRPGADDGNLLPAVSISGGGHLQCREASVGPLAPAVNDDASEWGRASR